MNIWARLHSIISRLWHFLRCETVVLSLDSFRPIDGQTLCHDCHRELTKDNISPWEVFIGGTLTAKVCRECDAARDKSLEGCVFDE